MKRHLAFVFICLLSVSGCRTSEPDKSTAGSVPFVAPSPSLKQSVLGKKSLFRDKASEVGIKFVHDSGANGKFYYIENTPPGAAFVDIDNDGWLDIVLVQSGSSEPFDSVKNRPTCAVYRNNQNGTFTDITANSGLDTDIGYGQGIAVGDFDNDGYSDLLITAYDRLSLFHNERGTGRFTNITATSGLDSFRGYFTSAAFGDYDNDGKLDLYVCRYGPWNWKSNIPCKDNLGLDYCPPIVYDTDEHLLLHNDGARFRDVSKASGILSAKGRGLGVVFLDYDRDGRLDIFVANDQSANMLWQNEGNGKFTNVSLLAGCAFDAQGHVSGMGVAVGDYDRSGNDSLYVGNFSGTPNMLFRNVGQRLFADESYSSGLALPHMKYVTFGTEFWDYDADGWLDILTVNGHVKMTVDQQSEGISYREPKQLFRNEGKGRFSEVNDLETLGSLTNATLGRGLAIGDYDNDGRLDALVCNQGGPTELIHNEAKNGNHWISFLPVGTKSNREGRHARFVLKAGEMTQTATVRGGSSYLSASDRRVYFGLGKKAKIDSVEIQWPSGTKDVLKNPPKDRIYTVTEGKGISASRH